MLLVDDDGVGMNPASHKQGYGMQGMRERVLALGGNFKVEGATNKGHSIRTLLPINQKGNTDEQ